MVKLEYFNNDEWISAGGPFGNERVAWMSLGGDDFNYRTVDENGTVLTDKSAEGEQMRITDCIFTV